MDKLSSLLKEAKPMYRAQKRNKAIMKMMCAFSIPLFIITSAIGVCNMGDDIYVSMQNDSLVEQLLYDDFGIVGIK